MPPLLSLPSKIVETAWHYRPTLSTEQLVLWVVVIFSVFYNIPFWQQALAGYDLLAAQTWLTFANMLLAMICLNFLVFVSFAFRTLVKPILTLLFLIAAFVSYFTSYYGTYFDTSMLDNVLQTDTNEAQELLTAGLLIHLAIFFGLPTVMIWRVNIAPSTWKKAMLRRLAYCLASTVILLLAIFLSYQDVSSLMRNNKQLRYLVTPGNYIVSMAQALSSQHASANTARLPVGEDAYISSQEGDKPTLLVIVVGETARAANWGLNGYERQTTPKLALQPDVINFSDVSSCGTSTAVSLPCMFLLPGRADYSKSYAQQHESLLDVLAHAGLEVTWLDNQSGCKGVCEGVTTKALLPEDYASMCQDGRCMDEALVQALTTQISSNLVDQVVVLHQLGNHGPSYYQRYPAAYERFVPACTTADLAKCSREAITNSYDNAILYTDTVLDQVIETLERQDDYATAMIYLSDHGESLGEKGLYLHGIPYAIAPDEQTHVPMVWWLSSTFSQQQGLDMECLRRTADQSASHDNLFHTVLGLLGVATDIYQQAEDISQVCRQPSSR
ncbi:phosphoethanolamine--lipid A transferase [Halomonas sp. ISL-60]|uniref:phosphoethanolamine transferase n=1 Tax=Halomonas sp. ISL-56 TaxID=2819149 RepID=UPI001BE71D43|nr:phosphoethanolamine--lipid A transferase [Halomonas sp. ISL-56]MBT2774347.1 phosphoethanolamine--lipid A transferase [Halomonas sp. ISL-60]MBT2799916.1 phosphoethanolamine--lipid A transferase [Halomonas sp. ISL-56]